MPRILLLFLFLLTPAAPTLAVSPRIVVTSLDGRQTEGELVALQPNTLSVKTESTTFELPLDSLLRIRPAEPSAKPESLVAFVELIDGSQLPLERFTANDGVTTIESPLSESPLQIATEQIRLVQLVGRASGDVAFWADLLEKHLPEDMLVVQKGKPVQLDYLPGVLGDVSGEVVDFTWDGEAIPVKRSKIAALTYYHAQQFELAEPGCWLITRRGARLAAASVSWKAGDETLEIATVTGLQLALPIGELHEADYSVGKLTYLSDLVPLKQKWTPRIDLPATAGLIRQHGLPRRDQSFAGSSLSLLWPAENGTGQKRTESYAKGLAVRSRTLLVYRVPAGMNRFTLLAGIDPATASQGHVTLEILADGNLLWQGEIEGGAAPLEINVPMHKARRLRLLVDYGKNLDYGDRLHLVDARFTK